MLLSIIVPVFNTEKYLDRCILSLLHQGLEEWNYEIILVNDGSTDGSLSICKRYSSEHTNIRMISQPNQGLSAARNTGIHNARGKYICFVDSDDYLEEMGLAKLLPWCRQGCDLIRYWCNIIHAHTQPQPTPEVAKETFSGSGYDYLKTFGLETFCWNWLYRRAFVSQNAIAFVPGLIGEDFRFMADVLFANPNMVSVACRIYNYVIRNNSITTKTTPTHLRKWVNDLISTTTEINKKVTAFKDTDMCLYERCMASLEGKMMALFSRALLCHYNISTFKREVLMPLRNIGILPLHRLGGSMRTTLSRIIINTLNYAPCLYKPAQWLFANIYHRYVYPRLDRNK